MPAWNTTNVVSNLSKFLLPSSNCSGMVAIQRFRRLSSIHYSANAMHDDKDVHWTALAIPDLLNMFKTWFFLLNFIINVLYHFDSIQVSWSDPRKASLEFMWIFIGFSEPLNLSRVADPVQAGLFYSQCSMWWFINFSMMQRVNFFSFSQLFSLKLQKCSVRVYPNKVQCLGHFVVMHP